MRYICTEDIENLAAQGKKELIVDENTVLLELARDMAGQLGIAIVNGAQLPPAKAAPQTAPATPAKAISPAAPAVPAKSGSPAAPAASSNGTAFRPGAKPKGCQHGPLPMAPRQASSNGHPNSDGVVDQLVDLVRQSVGKRSGN